MPPDVRLARTVRALRDAVVGCGAACLGLAVVAAAILALSGSDPLLAGPTLTILGGGQLLALVGERPLITETVSRLAPTVPANQVLVVTSADIADALRARGVSEPQAVLAARTGVTVFSVSYRRWIAPDEDRPLAEVQAATFADLRALADA